MTNSIFANPVDFTPPAMTMTLADRFAIAKAKLDAATKEVDALKAEIKALGMPSLEGDQCFVTLSLSERTTVDGKKALTFLTASQAAACQKTTLVETIKVVAKVVEVAA